MGGGAAAPTTEISRRHSRFGQSNLSAQYPSSSESEDEDDDIIPGEDRRRFLLRSVVGGVTGIASSLVLPTFHADFSPVASAAEGVDSSNTKTTKKKILVLGGTGLVGGEVVRVLKETSSFDVDVVATSRDGREGTIAFDVTIPGTVVENVVETLAKGCDAVISTVGAIGTPSGQDGLINGATGLAARGAKAAGVSKFVYVSVAPEVKDFAQNIEFLSDYMKGKTFSEESIESYYGKSGGATLIKPTFIYGGDKFGLAPPRVATGYGKLVESLLSSPPLRLATDVAPPGFVKIALEPPVSATAVAQAAVAAVLFDNDGMILDTHDKINEAAAKMLQ